MEARIFTEQEERKKIHVVREKKRERKALFLNRLLVVLFFIGFFSILGFYINSNAKVAALQEEVNRLKAEKKQMETDKLAYISKLEEKKASPLIKEEAMYKLGMQYPTSDQVIYVNVNMDGENEDKKDSSEILQALIKNRL